MASRADDLIVEAELSSSAIRFSTVTWIAAHLQWHGSTVRIALALTTGVAWALAAPPRGWWPMLSFGVAFLTLALHGRGARERCLFGGLTGVVFYGLTLRWLMDFSVPGYVAMVGLETSMLAAAVALIPAPGSGRWAGGWWTLPAALVLLEAVQLRFPLGGFPLPGLALSQAGGPFAMAAPLGGSLLVTALAAVSGVALAGLLVMPGGSRRIAAVGGAVGIILAPLLVGATITTRTISTLDVAVVQGGGPRGVLADPTRVTARHLAVMQQIVGSPDLVVLPENVVDVDGSIAGSLPDSQIRAQARRLDTSVVVGIVEKSGTKFRNAAVLWGPDGERLDRYEKEHRVPFGEYLPARRLLQVVSDATTLVPRDAIPGEGSALLSAPVGPLGVVISYEVFFADRVREAVTSGGQVVLVPTNAASYLTPEVPALEVAAARLRAREFGRAVLQAAPTGYSAVILPNGTVAAQSKLGAATLLRERIPLRSGLTPYARVGDLPMITLALAVLVARPLTPATRSLLRRRRRLL
ncbi:apolipoprotein N-acyltransferase [Pengzhenrongella phosphoraccumulans]|uniref:apolipoprotein N-acyltransferase n=1 Tax=Pengzhenrongella phosphoraccumulans TaxID=3114394 RepID=UPI003890705B